MNRDFDGLLKRAKEADDGDRPAESTELLKTASKSRCLPPFARLRLAENLRIIGKIDEADKIFATLKDSDVPTEQVWLLALYRGQLYVDKRNFALAISSFQKAIEKNPEVTAPYVFLAATHASIQEPEKAIEVLLRGVQAMGHRNEVYLNLGYNYRTLGKYALAKTAFTNALEISPHYPEAQSALSDVESALKFMEEAE